MENIEKKAFKKLFKKYIKPYKGKFAILYTITMLSNILGLLPIYFMGNIINYVVMKSFDKILYTIGILCTLFLGNSILSIGETYLAGWLNNEITKKIKDDIYSKATDISITNFQKISSGHIISLIEGDSVKIADFFVSKIIGVLVAAVTLVVSLFFLFKLSFSLTFIAIVSFPIGFIGNLLCGKKINKETEALRKLSDENYTFLNKTFSGIKEVKSYVIERKMIEKFKKYTYRIQERNMKVTILEIFSGMFSVLVSSIADWLIIGYGTWKIIAGTFSIGSYVAFNGYSGSMFGAIRELLNINVTFRTIEISLDRISLFLETPSEKNNRQGNIEPLDGDIVFENVSFSYNTDSQTVLNDFNATFKKNELSVIVGTNGIGKSTVLSLIEQFYQPQEGKILIGRSDLKEMGLECLRKNIGMVQQHPMILTGTLRENLEYGNENINVEILDKVCAAVGLTNFVNSLPYGYDTQLGEISGGQKQRIAIARVLVKNPSILLLDEITSDLDGKSEKEIIAMLKQLSREKTVILISHRANAIVGIANIYVMDQGRIIEQGQHKELLKKCRLYSALVNDKEEVAL